MINLLKEELQDIVNNQEVSDDLHRRKELTIRIESLWREEEIYWRLRFRINWLKWGIEIPKKKNSYYNNSKEADEQNFHA